MYKNSVASIKKQNKGFTLAELLIVVAIIAVLVAISIPLFTTQLEKSREATDLANVRSAYAEVMTAALTEDSLVTYIDPDGNETTIKNGDTYSMTVALKQKQDDWQSALPLNIAEAKSESTNGGTPPIGEDGYAHWEGVPGGSGGRCTISYSADSGIMFSWSGGAVSSYSTIMKSTHDYVADVNTAMTGKTTGSWCLNSTCNKNGTIKGIAESLTDPDFISDIATWAVVRDTSTTANNNSNNSVLLSTFDITTLTAGTEVPAIYCLKDGTYMVGTAQVNTALDKNDGKAYNILTIDRNGNYAYTYPNGPTGGGQKNTEYDYTNLLKDVTSYTSREEAQAAYKTLVSQYISNNPGMSEGKK